MLIKIIFLGIVQGLTEFLPISSSGHLVLIEKTLNLSLSSFLSCTAFFHLGTTLAIIFYFRRRIYEICKNIFQPQAQRSESIRIVVNVAIGSIPVAIIGYFLRSHIEYFFSSRLYFVGLFLIINGILLFVTKFITARNIQLTPWRSLTIGIAQALALLPGISRSGITITTGLILGLSSVSSFEFSFLLALPAIIGANILVLREIVFHFSIIDFIIGFFVPFIIGVGALRLLNKMVIDKKFYHFAYYSWFLGVLILPVGLL
ncbi:MAG: undecaprenyl-diphosphate phosphatase [candidate division WOR-3 bacterium]